MENKDTPNRSPHYKRLSKGFMGQTWDGGDLAFKPELWTALKDMLLPGAFCFAFAGSRGWHRMAVAIEDAGFIMHPTIFGWAYGSGFPKATRIDTQIDKAAIVDCPNCEGSKIEPTELWMDDEAWLVYAEANPCDTCKGTGKVKGAEREIIGINKTIARKDGRQGNSLGKQQGQSGNITASATPEAAAWEGHRYGLQAIKPAVEPILCFQKPYRGRPLDGITATGAGALNIEGGRHHPKGRWPSNLALSHSPDCERVGVKRVRGSQGISGGSPDGKGIYGKNFPRGNRQQVGYTNPDGNETIEDWQCVENCPVKKLDEQSGVLKSGGKANTEYVSKETSEELGNKYGKYNANKYKTAFMGSSGGASRFFHQSHFAYEIHERIAAADPVRYVAKAGNTERNAGLDQLPSQIRHRMRPDKNEATGLNKEPRWSPVETKNIHPTVKPLALAKYLASLLLPPDSYAPRRILVPFAGSGSEMIGTLLAGWDEVTGIEMTKKYIPIAKARLEWWLHWLKWGQDDIDIILATAEDNQQLSFLDDF